MRIGGDDEKGDVMEDMLRSSNGPRKSILRKSDLTEAFEQFSQIEVDEYLRFVNANGDWCDDRRFFKTGNGQFGWSPDGVGEGDVVIVVEGLGVPLVLRPVGEGFVLLWIVLCMG